MTQITFTNLHNQTHQFSAGLVTIEQDFEANLLALEVTTKPEYEANSQIIGYLYQVYGTQGKGYALRTGKDLIRLDLPQTDRLIFAPTAYLSDSFTLKIEYTTIGISAVIDGENIAAIPEQILSLPNNLQAINLQLDLIEQAIADLAQDDVDWAEILNKPPNFPPASHNHTIADVSLLDLELQSLDTRLDLLESAPPPVSVISGYLPLSTNQTLEVNKKYLATVSGLICTLPSSPNIGDFVEISTGNFDLRVNHGNATQVVRNSSTNTVQGAENGIILKPYSAITLLFVGSNLWISAITNRVINNWVTEGLTETSFNFVNFDDTNGYFYFLGTNGNTAAYSLPVPSKVISVESSSNSGGNTADKAIDRVSGSWFNSAANQENSFCGYLLVPDVTFRVTSYTLKSRPDFNGWHPRNWVLEGSNNVSANNLQGFNSATWQTIDSRVNDLFATGTNVSKLFTCNGDTSTPYEAFRIRTTGLSSASDFTLTIGEFEIYGVELAGKLGEQTVN